MRAQDISPIRRLLELSMLALLLALPAIPASADEDSEPFLADELFVIYDGELQRRGIHQDFLLPVGPVDIDAVAMEFTDDGDLLALVRDGAIYRIDQQTAVAEMVAPPRALADEAYLEMARASRGRLFLIKERPDLKRDLVLLELHTQSEQNLGTLHSGESGSPAPGSINTLAALAIADGNLVGLDADFSRAFLHSVGPATASFHQISSGSFGIGPTRGPLQMDVDSEGLIWISTFVLSTPPGRIILAVDPERLITVAERPTFRFNAGDPLAIAVRRGSPPTCRGSETTICLLEDRFQVSATWRDFDGNTGVGRIVPGASETTTLFSFFSPDNQELMVKVLDGCGFNDHVWVFLSGTTNVEFSLRVVDTLIEQEVVYDNALGETATTVLDTEAFVSCQDAGIPIGG